MIFQPDDGHQNLMAAIKIKKIVLEPLTGAHNHKKSSSSVTRDRTQDSYFFMVILMAGHTLYTLPHTLYTLSGIHVHFIPCHIHFIPQNTRGAQCFLCPFFCVVVSSDLAIIQLYPIYTDHTRLVGRAPRSLSLSPRREGFTRQADRPRPPAGADRTSLKRLRFATLP